MPILTGVGLFGSVLQDSVAVEAGDVDRVGHGSGLRVTTMRYGDRGRGEWIARKTRSSD